MKTFTKFWKNLKNNVTAHDVIVHCALKAFFASESNEYNKDQVFRSLISKSFTPITNKNKINNGATPLQSLKANWKFFTNDIHREEKNIGIFGASYNETMNEIFSGSKTQFQEFVTFYNMLYNKIFIQNLIKVEKRYYSYIFVDQKDVEPIHQTVQAGHVAMVIGQKMDKKFDAHNVYFQICKLPQGYVGNLAKFQIDLEEEGFKVETFFEPDMNRTVTIGIHPVMSHKRKWLKRCELLNF